LDASPAPFNAPETLTDPALTGRFLPAALQVLATLSSNLIA